MNSTFRDIDVKDVIRECTTGTITTNQSTGILLDMVAKKSSKDSLLEDIKFMFYYVVAHLQVLVAEIDEELCFKRK